MAHINNPGRGGSKQNQPQARSQPKTNTRDRIDNHTGQSHERDQLRGAFNGKQNETDLKNKGTNEKNRKYQDHDSAEQLVEDDGII